MIHTPCTFCGNFVQSLDGKPFTCPTCQQWLSSGLIQTITIPPCAYSRWGDRWLNELRQRQLYCPSDRILGASP